MVSAVSTTPDASATTQAAAPTNKTQNSPARGLTADDLKTIQNAIDSAAVKVTFLGQINEAGFDARVEKHLSDYRSGRGYLSKDTAGELGTRDQSAANILAGFSPSSSKLYNVYKTTFGYENQARFVQALSGFTKDLSTISRKA